MAYYICLILRLHVAVGKPRRLQVEEIDDVFLKTGWLPDTVEHGTIQLYDVSETAKSGRTRIVVCTCSPKTDIGL